MLTLSVDQRYCLVDAAAGIIVRGPHAHAKPPIRAMAMSAGGRLLATAQQSAILLADPGSGKARGELRGHASAVLALAFSPDGKLLAPGGADGTVLVWDVASGMERSRVEHRLQTVYALAFSRDGAALVASGLGGVAASIVAECSGRRPHGRCLVRGRRENGAKRRQVLNLDLAKFDRGAGVLVQDDVAAGRELLFFVQQLGNRGSVYFDGHQVLACDHLVGKPRANWCGRFLGRDAARTGEAARRQGADPVAERAVVDLATKKSLYTFIGHAGPVSVIHFTPDGSAAASGAQDTSALLWGVDNGAKEIEWHLGR